MSKKSQFEFSQEQRCRIDALIAADKTRPRIRNRARIIKCLMDGQSAYSVARSMGIRLNTAYKWRDCFLVNGVDGLKDAYRGGQPRRITEEETQKVLTLLDQEPPGKARRWTLRLLSKCTEVNLYRVMTIMKSANKALPEKTARVSALTDRDNRTGKPATKKLRPKTTQADSKELVDGITQPEFGF